MRVNFNKDHDEVGRFADVDGQPGGGGKGAGKTGDAPVAEGGALNTLAKAALIAAGFVAGAKLGSAAGSLANYLGHKALLSGSKGAERVFRDIAMTAARGVTGSATKAGRILPGGKDASVGGAVVGAIGGAAFGAAAGKDRRPRQNAKVEKQFEPAAPKLDAESFAHDLKVILEAAAAGDSVVGVAALKSFHEKYQRHPEAMAALEELSADGAVEEGVKAHRAGSGIHKNPYAPKSNAATHWNTGWRKSNGR